MLTFTDEMRAQVRHLAWSGFDHKYSLKIWREMYNASEVRACNFKRLFNQFVNGRTEVQSRSATEINKRAAKQKKAGLPHKFVGVADTEINPNANAKKLKQMGEEYEYVKGSAPDINHKAKLKRLAGEEYKYVGTAGSKHEEKLKRLDEINRDFLKYNDEFNGEIDCGFGFGF